MLTLPNDGQRQVVPGNRRRLGCGAAIACAVVLVAGCGSSGDKTPDRTATQHTQNTENGQATATANNGRKTPAKKRIPRCGPTLGSPTSLKNVRTAKPGQKFNVKLSKLRLGSGNARVTVVGTFNAGKKLKNTITGKGSFTAKKGRFVTVVYELTNRGDKPVPVSSVIAAFRVVATNKAYPLTDALPKCGPISASLVTSPDLPSSLKGKLSSPGRGVKPGEIAESIAVYTLPGKTSPGAWFSPRLKLAVDLSKASTIK